MLPKIIEEIVTPVDEKFVASLNGRYSRYCSDPMLVALIVYNLGKPSYREPEKSLAEAMIKGDSNAAYDATRWLFEHILEYKCHAGGNGHHVAQAFSVAMSVLTKPDK